MIMKKSLLLTAAVLMIGLTALSRPAWADDGFKVVTGKPADNAIPNDFYLEGNRIPVQKRNAVLVNCPMGGRIVIGLIDTTGYSSQIQQKYEGMLISETHFTIGGQKIGVGSFGFGHTKPAATSDEDMRLTIYDQAGNKVAEATGKKDASLSKPSPLQVKDNKLYLGRYAFDLK
jgi:hypothetical protein